MSSPWSVPLWDEIQLPEEKKETVAQTAEPFGAHAAMDKLDLLLTKTMLPLLDATVSIDRRLEQRGAADIVEGTMKEILVEAGGTVEGLDAIPSKNKKSMEDVTTPRPEGRGFLPCGRLLPASGR